jgi:protein-S-isoprenylcysteine O-methyltransferase Ste14
MTLVPTIDADIPRADTEPVIADRVRIEPAVEPRRKATESFPLFVRVAGEIWFGLLALGYLRLALVTATDVISGSGGISTVVLFTSRLCTALFFGLTCWLLMVRPAPIASQNRAAPVVTAFAGTYLVWLTPFLPAAPANAGLQLVSAAIVLIGDALIIYTLCNLGRSFSIVPQARRLVTTGPYRFVRHPLYATEGFALLGILLQHVWWAAVPFLVVQAGLQWRRMAYEEALLRAMFPDYSAYARRTARLIPGVW